MEAEKTTKQIEELNAEVAALRLLLSTLLCYADREQVRTVANAAVAIRDTSVGEGLTEHQRGVVVGRLTSTLEVVRMYQRQNFRGGLKGLWNWVASGAASMRRAILGCQY
jgi:hypothetical protein